MTHSLNSHYPVIVVGAGPTGLTLANLLGAYGVSVLLVERNPSTVGEPRAVSIDDESLRTIQALGLVDTVLTEVVSGYGSEYYSRKGRLFLKVQPTDEPYGYPRRNAFRQPILEAQLRDGLKRYPNVTTLFSCALRDFSESDKSVHVNLESDTGPLSISCDYLVGCDGASSNVRAGLGVDLQGKSFEERWLILDLENTTSPSRETYVMCDATRPYIALPGPRQTRRFEYKLHPYESADDMLRPEVVDELLSRGEVSPGSKLIRKCVYRFHARLAERWSSQRIFLAGDAAHLTPPFAGQGMNSGVRDAHNLAWKLAFVVQGRLGTQLLHTYEQERRDHVLQMIQLALRMGRIMGPANRYSGWIAQTAFRWLGIWPAARDYFGQMKYKPKPHFRRGFLFAEPMRGRSSLVGRLLPQPRVTRRDGHSVLLDEVLGSGFALLCHAGDLEQFKEFIRHPTWRAAELRRVALGTANEVHAADDDIELVTDADGQLLDELSGYRGRVLLVRPDHYVAATFGLNEAEKAAKRFDELIAGTWPDNVTRSGTMLA